MRILCIEPDIVLAQTVVSYLQAAHEVSWAHSGHHAIELMDKEPFDIIVTEHTFAGHNSFEFLYELRSYPEWQTLPVVLLTRSYLPDKVRNSDTWRQLGNIQYLYKPSTSLALLASTLNRLAPKGV